MSAGDEARKRILRRKHAENAMNAAFDNELDEVEDAFNKAAADGVPLPVNPAPAPDGVGAADREDSFLGEAACGNAVDVMKFLMERGADISYKGKHNRTPLQRALNNDGLDAARLLLEAGADPRLLVPQEREGPSDEYPNGRILFHEWDPEEVNGLQCSAEAKKLLKGWDISKTLKLLRENEAGAVRKAAAEKEEKAQAAVDAQQTVEARQAAYDAALQAYRGAVQLREARIQEYDTCKCEGKTEGLDILDGMIKKAMEEAKAANVTLAECEHALKKAKKDMRVADAAAQGDTGRKYDFTIGLSQLEDVVMDVGGVVAASGKVCLLIDQTGNALTFLTYRSVTVVDIGNSHHMHAEQLRLGILGALRYGKPYIINLRNKDLPEAFMTLKERFEAVQPGVFQKLIKNEMTKPEHYKPLITDELVAAQPDLHHSKFKAGDTTRFKFVLITHEECPQDWEVLEQFFSVLCV